MNLENSREGAEHLPAPNIDNGSDDGPNKARFRLVSHTGSQIVLLVTLACPIQGEYTEATRPSGTRGLFTFSVLHRNMYSNCRGRVVMAKLDVEIRRMPTDRKAAEIWTKDQLEHISPFSPE